MIIAFIKLKTVKPKNRSETKPKNGMPIPRASNEINTLEVELSTFLCLIINYIFPPICKNPI